MRAGQIDLLDLQLPIAIRPSTPISDEELMRFSQTNRSYRIERNKDGEITMMTPLGGEGGGIEMLVSYLLMSWAVGDRTGKAFSPSTGFNLPDGSCLSPDAAWLPFLRWNALTPAQRKGYPPLCPNFIIEIRSPSDSKRICEVKMQTWIDNGAELAWLIDPIDGDAVIYRPGYQPETLIRPEIIVGIGPVAGFNLPTTGLWSQE